MNDVPPGRPLWSWRPSARVVVSVVVVIGLTMVGLGAVLLHRDGAPAPSYAAPARPAAPLATPSPSASTPPPTAVAATPSPSAAASRLIGEPTGDVLVIPALSVQAPLISVAMSRQAVLTPPRNPREVGYWDGSAPPGSRTGQTLITGHTVHTGGGALDRLGDLRPGQQVVVHRGQAADRVTAAYRVAAVRTYSVAALADKSQKLFGQQSGHGRLVLVTCTGWDGREYHGNVVVTATPVTGA